MNKKRISKDYTLKYAYEIYKNSVDKKDPIYNISRVLFGKICGDFNKEIVNRIIFDNFEFKMFSRGGILSLRKYKQKIWLDKDGNVRKKFLKVDPYATMKLREEDPEAARLNKVVYFDNAHSDGYKYCIFWSKASSTIKNCSKYIFRPVRDTNRLLAKAIKEKTVCECYEYEPNNTKNARKLERRKTQKVASF
jgi:hypothetical protein